MSTAAFVLCLFGLVGAQCFQPMISHADAATYTVIYHSNTKADETAKQKIKAKKAKITKMVNFTKEGYTIKGWSTKPGGKVKYLTSDRIYGSELAKKGEKTIHLYAKWKKNGETKRRTLSIVDTTSRDWDNLEGYDALVEIGYFKNEAANFRQSIGKNYKNYVLKDITATSQIRKKIARVFRNSDENDINIIYLAGHGSKNELQVGCHETTEVVEFLGMCGWELHDWCDRYIRGTTIVITGQCEAKYFAKDFYKNDLGYWAGTYTKAGERKRLRYARQHYAIMTAVGYQSNYTGAEEYWFDVATRKDTAKRADVNGDHKITVQELHDYTSPLQLAYNRELDSNCDKGVLFGKVATGTVLFKY